MNYSEVFLDKEAALAWMTKSLAIGPSLDFSKSVAQVCLQRQSIAWNYSVVVNEDVNLGDINNFSQGGKVSSDIADAWLLQKILLLKFNYSHVIVEDWRANPRSTFLATKSMPAFFIGEQVYYIVSIDDLVSSKNLSLIISNSVPCFNGFVTRIARVDELAAFVKSCGLSDCEEIGGIFCGAYDGEGYIFASRKVLNEM